MIISLTEKCSEGCSHCFINSLPKSPIMTEETLEGVIEFLNRIKPMVILLSGGEFTEHPEFYRFAMRIIHAVRPHGSTMVNLLSNGSWFFDERKADMIKLMAEPEVKIVQIRTHKKYYPNYKRTIAAKAQIEALSDKIAMFEDGIDLFPLGRARANHKDEIARKYPMCSNLFLIVRQGAVTCFAGLLQMLEMQGRVCAPFLSSKGILHAGETPYCENIGNVKSTDAEIFENILRNCKPKNVCGLYKNLPANAKAIIENV